MNELETLLTQSLKHWQKEQEQTLTAQNTHINKLEEKVKTQGMHQEVMQTQLNELQSSLWNLEPLLQRLNEALKRV